MSTQSTTPAPVQAAVPAAPQRPAPAPRVKLGWRSRITTLLWGLLVLAVGGAAVIELNGQNIDMEVVFIGALIVMGTWLVISALLPRRD